MTDQTQGIVASKGVRDAVRKVVTEEGEAAAAKRLQLSRQTLARVIGGLPVREGTLALLREKGIG